MGKATRYQVETLKGLLVAELRGYQSLDDLVRSERDALAYGDALVLAQITERKEAQLDDLSRLHESRRILVQEIGETLGLNQPVLSLSDILPQMDGEDSLHLGQLRDGLLALIDRIRHITRNNLAMAGLALERADALQLFLLNLLHAPTGYRPQGLPPLRDGGVALEIDQAA